MNILCILLQIQCTQRIANTSEGLLQGYEVISRSGRSAFGFSGIPYAKPPLGELRFQDPQLPNSWRGIRNAVRQGNICVQHFYLIPGPLGKIVYGNEDCLYLSVFTPKLKPATLYPVLVYIHGGAFEVELQSLLFRPDYFMDHDVVVIMFNYRVGALGFLSMEDKDLSGNYGLRDQVMALKWVQRNINNFGGDPRRVTVFGESAGAASVVYHMISPLSKGLIHGGISQSGSAFAKWAITKPGEARRMAIKTAEGVGCPINNTREMVLCLREKNPYQIARQQHNFEGRFVEVGPVFVPSPDPLAKKPFLPREPHYMKIEPIPWMTGISNYDGTVKSGSLTYYPEIHEALEKNFTQSIVGFLPGLQKGRQSLRKIRKFYFGRKKISPLTIVNVTNMVTDYFFLWPMVKTLRQHHGPQYVYYNTFEGKNSMQSLYARHKIVNGSSHGDEMIYLWNVDLIIESLTKLEEKFSKFLVNLWVNMAKYGTPTPPGYIFDWPQWDKVNQRYVTFTQTGVKVKSELLKSRTKFWDLLE